jgi:alpha-ketoglutaric semialdehyde dehydrogenase
LRKTHVGIGPVVIFGASNFPLAYSTLGGDTVSAWVAGCPVIVKSHPMHAGTGEFVSRCIVEAIRKSGMPEGIFSNLNGKSFEVGEKLVRHPLFKAVGFTGSMKGGRSLYDLASRRSEPIPFFAEMGSLNPVVLFDKSTDTLSKQAILLARAVTTDAGQFCTKPGVIFVNSNISEFFVGELELALSDSATHTMLHEELYMRYIKRLDEVNQTNGVRQRRFTKEGALSLEGVIAISQTTINYLLTEETLRYEVFGPHVLVVEYEGFNELGIALKQLGGQLTISVFCNDSAQIEQSFFIQVAYDIAGRVIWNGVPTGVAVNLSSNHGGPYPATTDSRFSSVGLDSWKRFARFVTWQDTPQKILPDALRNKNPLGIVRKVNGKLTNLSWH